MDRIHPKVKLNVSTSFIPRLCYFTSSVVRVTPKYKTLKLAFPPLWLHRGRIERLASQPRTVRTNPPAIITTSRTWNQTLDVKRNLRRNAGVANQAEDFHPTTTEHSQHFSETCFQVGGIIYRPTRSLSPTAPQRFAISHDRRLHYSAVLYSSNGSSVFRVDSPGAHFGSFICRFH